MKPSTVSSTIRARSRPGPQPLTSLETETELIFKVDVMAGVNLKDIDVQVENGTMTLKGERKFEKDDKVTGYHRMERPELLGVSSARSFTLPNTVDPEGVRADYAQWRS